MRHGGQILIDQLKIQGVERVFCIPGESYLPALDCMEVVLKRLLADKKAVWP